MAIARLAVVLVLVALVAGPALAQDPPVRIGYAIARTGPWAAGAQVTQEPNYLLWAEQVNAAGGLNVQGKRRKVELTGFDDRSETETVVRTFEKLMGTDKVDLVLVDLGEESGAPGVGSGIVDATIGVLDVPAVAHALQRGDGDLDAWHLLVVGTTRDATADRSRLEPDLSRRRGGDPVVFIDLACVEGIYVVVAWLQREFGVDPWRQRRA